MGAKPSPTSGRVSIEILSGGALSKMKLRKRVSDRSRSEVGHVEVEPGQMRQQYVTLLVTHREIVAGTVIEIANPGEVHAVAVDKGARHHRDFRPPVAIVRGTDGDPPRQHDKKQRDRDGWHPPLA